ncbi:hypothetical protein BDW22DRAFT_1342467 [Trametopsis cervina]|nr:hypothetical protein BDW22DRAFT_1342467 [Trametopsis cervina]
MAFEAKTQPETEPVAVYTPMRWTVQEIRDAIPSKYFERSTATSFRYLAQDIVMATCLGVAASHIDPWFRAQASSSASAMVFLQVAKWATWAAYWWFQGLVFTGMWIVGHECGHGSFSPHKFLSDVVGFVLHSFLWTPYHSWRISHHHHHMYHNSMERDEAFVPKVRSELGIPNVAKEQVPWHEHFEDTPIYTLLTLIPRHLLGFPIYLLFNASGQKDYPWPTSHIDPTAVIFDKSQRHLIVLSDIGLLIMGLLVKAACDNWGAATVFKLYGIPWLLVSHWLVTVTYLHHTDPVVPHYRGKAWTYARGAASTVDRDFLGWQGYFFLHGISHYHVIHHFFPRMPHYHGKEATQYLKAFLGEHYHHSDVPVFQALWQNYNACQFVEDEGDVLFYRDKQGNSVAQAAETTS